ncbi:Glycosyltransferase, family I [Desulfonema limicola]|uniref:Glycosyltransferase, family I n=1 Tax=Desulfonema limicola TaxID=45656 RepID=A0A975GFT0_9BACT|nr:glycosyltransferase family 4 protein [Desulfonema limicola]QTA79485.1 Glycosyltransferase, family I [Desulfonema limicola]
MKILFLSDVPMKDPSSGSERVLYEQAAGFFHKGFEVYAITRSNGSPGLILRNTGGVYEACYNAPVDKIFVFLSSLIKFPVKLYRQFTGTMLFNLIICHQPFTCAVLLLLADIRKIPILYVFHSPSHEEYLLLNHGKKRFLNFCHIHARRFIEAFCMKKAFKIITLSSYMKKKAGIIHKIPEHKIIVNPGGVDLEYFQLTLDQEKLKHKLNFPGSKIHLLTIRNLEPRMGLDNLLKAVFILKQKLDIYLVIGGQGSQRKILENMINDLDLKEQVVMPGYLPPRLLPDYYGASDFFILPTLNLEGFGLVTIESMACGTPVLGTPVGGTKEILSGFNKQFIFKDSSPESMVMGIEKNIEQYMKDKKAYGMLRYQCRKYAVENYSWERHVNLLAGIVNKN